MPGVARPVPGGPVPDQRPRIGRGARRGRRPPEDHGGVGRPDPSPSNRRGDPVRWSPDPGRVATRGPSPQRIAGLAATVEPRGPLEVHSAVGCGNRRGDGRPGDAPRRMTDAGGVQTRLIGAAVRPGVETGGALRSPRPGPAGRARACGVATLLARGGAGRVPDRLVAGRRRATVGAARRTVARRSGCAALGSVGLRCLGTETVTEVGEMSRRYPGERNSSESRRGTADRRDRRARVLAAPLPAPRRHSRHRSAELRARLVPGTWMMIVASSARSMGQGAPRVGRPGLLAPLPRTRRADAAEAPVA